LIDIFIVSRDESKQSIIGCLGTAIALRQKGLAVTLMYEQNAMVALAERKFEYTGLLESYADITERAISDHGFPSEPMELLKIAKDVGVDIISCPIWTDVARSRNVLPSELRIVELDELFTIIASAKKILGSF